MKAHKGDAITCECRTNLGEFTKVGEFSADVADDAPITSAEIHIDGDVAEPDIANGSWTCRVCQKQVARHTKNGWVVRTRDRWLS